MNVVLRENQQCKEIVARLDFNLNLCAQKHEIVEYTKELRFFCKEKNFLEH
jgi:hypothetical protein